MGLRVVVDVIMGLRVVVDVVMLDIPGSMLSFGFIGNPVRVEFFIGATVILLGDVVTLSNIAVVLYPAIIKILIVKISQD